MNAAVRGRRQAIERLDKACILGDTVSRAFNVEWNMR